MSVKIDRTQSRQYEQAGTTRSRSIKKVYKIKGQGPTPTDWDASNISVELLLKDYPALFVLDRVKFNALAKTGMLDNHANVTVTEEYIYSQKGGA